METMAFLGCSRGLGQAVTLEMDEQRAVDRALLVARSEQGLKNLGGQMQASHEVLALDFASRDQLPKLLEVIKRSRPSRIFYFAGGGPHGLFLDKKWKDHLWALQVSFLTPSELLHQLMTLEGFDFVKQVVFIGSLVADSQPDPLASSYASAKHGLKGLVESLQGETLPFDLRFFRPGYMNTDLLPKNAKPRVEGQIIADPRDVAQRFVAWVMDAQGRPVLDDSPL